MSGNLPALAQAKRTSLLLSLATAAGGSAGPIVIGTGGLASTVLLPPEQLGLATAPITAYVLGAAIGSIPAALLMQRVGRRAGFLTGVAMGAGGAALAALAILLEAFWLLLAAMPLLGIANAFVQQYRFAAADASPPDFKAKAISWVLIGGIATGIVGPQIAIGSTGLVPGAPFAGAFVVLIGLYLLTGIILGRLRLPEKPAAARRATTGRPLLSIVGQPKLLIAIVTAASCYALMNLVMTATPLAMVGHHHHSHIDAQLAIQWHVIAMYAPSLFTGYLTSRLGKTALVAVGLGLIALSAAVALAGTSVLHFWAALVLLGLGWNFGFVAATAIVAELYRPEEAFKVQALNEFVVFGTVAIASFSSGRLLDAGGWATVNLVAFPLVAGCLLLVVGQAIYERLNKPAR